LITPIGANESGLVVGQHEAQHGDEHTHGDTEHENPLGTEGRIEGLANLDDALDIAQIIARFRANTNAGIAESTQQEYIDAFKKLLRRFGYLDKNDRLIGSPTRRKFAGKQGRTLILAFLPTVKRESWAFHESALKKFWADGLEVDWPLRPRDIGRRQTYKARRTPIDPAVHAWKNAIDGVKDPWLNLMLRLFWQYGLRPSHLANIKWRNIEHDSNGEPYAISACEDGFKTRSPIRAVLFPDVKMALCEWAKISPNTAPNAPILCWKNVVGETDGTRPAREDLLRGHWYRFGKNHDLPRLQPNAARHFVSTASRKAGLSEPATNLLQGHKVRSGTSCRQVYDNEEPQELLSEQERVFPNGPLGWLCAVKVESSGLPREVADLVSEFMRGTVPLMDFADRMDRLQRMPKVAEAPKVEL